MMCNVVYVVFCTYGVECLLYIWCCVHISYEMLGIDGVMYMFHM